MNPIENILRKRAEPFTRRVRIFIRNTPPYQDAKPKNNDMGNCLSMTK
jgi:hypothetical protein